MPAIPVTTALGYVGVFLLLLGVLLFLAGKGIISIQQISVEKGKQTCTFATVSVVLGLAFLLWESVASIIPTAVPTPTPESIASIVPTAVPTPMPESIASIIPTAVPTLTSGPQLTTGMLMYQEDFSPPGAEWIIEDHGDVAYALDGDAYSIEVRQEDLTFWMETEGEYGDFVLEFDAALVEGDEWNAYGVLFRYKDKANHYELMIGGNRSYAVSKLVSDEWTAIIEWTSSAAIRPAGQVNHVRLVAFGGTFVLYINDQLVDQFTDTSLSSGDIALAVGTWDSPPARAIFDDLAIWDVGLALE